MLFRKTAAPKKAGAPKGDDGLRTGIVELLPRLWRFGVVLSRDPALAEDLVQATCLRALERADQFEAGSRLDHWTFSILRSIWLNEMRARRVRSGSGTVDAETALSLDGAGRMEANILARQVLSDAAALPEGQREAVFLVYVEGLTYREASEMLEVPVGTVMSRLATARRRLGERHADAPARRGEKAPPA